MALNLTVSSSARLHGEFPASLLKNPHVTHGPETRGA